MKGRDEKYQNKTSRRQCHEQLEPKDALESRAQCAVFVSIRYKCTLVAQRPSWVSAWLSLAQYRQETVHQSLCKLRSSRLVAASRTVSPPSWAMEGQGLRTLLKPTLQESSTPSTLFQEKWISPVKAQFHQTQQNSRGLNCEVVKLEQKKQKQQ